jgi:hypothetical protein
MYMHLHGQQWAHVNTLTVPADGQTGANPRFENLLVSTHFLNVEPPYGLRHLPMRFQVGFRARSLLSIITHFTLYFFLPYLTR